MAKTKIKKGKGFKFDGKEVEKTILALLAREPFYYYIFMNLNRVNDPRLPAIMAVAIPDLTNYQLIYNPKYELYMESVEKLEEATTGKPLPPMESGDLLCILKHEICHIILRHVLDERIKTNPQTWNLATDCAINQMIGGWSDGAKARFIYPKTLEKFIKNRTGKRVKVPDGKDAVFYYNLLIDNVPREDREGKPAEGGEGGEGEGKQFEGSFKDLMDYISKTHGKWAELDSDSKDFIEENLKRMVMDAKEQCQNAGHHTGDYDFIFGTFKNTRTLNWKQLLRRSFQYDITDLDYTFKRPDRRLRNMFPGKKRQETVNFIWAIDTSGSVSDSDFNRVLNELKKISRQFNKDKLRVIQIDTEIKSDKIENIRHLKNFKFHGRGGTDMDPIFDRLKKEKNRLPVILFTDGYFFHNLDTSKYRFPCIILLTETGTEEYLKKAKNCRVIRVLPEEKKR